MKKSVLHKNHTGVQPIRVLKHNITHRLAERNEELIKSLHADLKLSKYIKYNSNNLSLKNKQTPFIDENGVINIHESFLSYIWIVSYTIFVLYEEGIVIPDQIFKGIKPSKNQNPALIELVKELFEYGKSLITSYFPWDKEYYPNPEFYDRHSDEGWYIERTNDLYVEIVNFILYHEIAHAEYQHLHQKNSGNLTSEEIKKMEIQADTRAIELLLNTYRSKVATEVAATIGLASMIFFTKDLRGDNEHPDVDERINNLISIIKPNKENVVWAFLVVFIKLWSEQFGHTVTHDKIYNDFSELYYELAAQLGWKKNTNGV
jgi:hypothetical protein